MKNVLFQQLFEGEKSTFTYLLANPDTREAVIIDPVLETCSRDPETSPRGHSEFVRHDGR